MKKIPLALALVAAALMTASANADIFTIDANVDSVDAGPVFDATFDLGNVASIKSITVDMAHTWGGDVVMNLVNVGNGTTYDLMNNDADETGSGNYDLGMVAGDASLGNAAAYTFVAPGGGMPDFLDDFSPGGTYDANAWGGGGSGDWVFTVSDSANGDPTSIGTITIDYNTGIPEPTSAALIIGMVGFVAARRRR